MDLSSVRRNTAILGDNALPLPVSLRASSMGLGIPGTVVTLLTTLALGFLPHNGYGGMEQGEKWAALELGDL